MGLALDPKQRAALWRQVEELVESYTASVGELPVSPKLDPDDIRARLAQFDFELPVRPEEALAFAARQLSEFQVHTRHPRYFGLFNPRPTAMGVFADAMVAGFNPQMAAWSHSPFACEAEAHVIRALGGRFGYAPDSTDGVFCSGGAEANHTALLTALTNEFPYFGERGARGLAAQPVFYVSAEAHHSFHKAARLCGIGLDALRPVPVDAQLRMRSDALAEMIAADRWAGLAPFLIVATAGTTNAGACDPLPAIAAVARAERLWLHADAAWGGAAALAPSVRHVLNGIERANSITFDAHKWLSVPMGAGIYLTRHRNILTRTFGTPNAYMPKEAAALDVTDPHQHSMQWSRRFIGLKVFLSLAVAGWQGYEECVEHMVKMGAFLKDELRASRWRVLNETPLPIACFADGGGADPQATVNRVLASGQAWCSTTILGDREKVLRACITNYATTEADVLAFVAALNDARK
ncbi:MAG: pyridoxal-dependent decarboxylase [Acidobacteriota bacterium]